MILYVKVKMWFIWSFIAIKCEPLIIHWSQTKMGKRSRLVHFPKGSCFEATLRGLLLENDVSHFLHTCPLPSSGRSLINILQRCHRELLWSQSHRWRGRSIGMLWAACQRLWRWECGFPRRAWAGTHRVDLHGIETVTKGKIRWDNLT